MSNLTISVDDQVLKRARIRALEQGSSVNVVLREPCSRRMPASVGRSRRRRPIWSRYRRAPSHDARTAAGRAKNCMSAGDAGRVVLSPQVQQEFFVTVTRMLAVPICAPLSEPCTSP